MLVDVPPVHGAVGVLHRADLTDDRHLLLRLRPRLPAECELARRSPLPEKPGGRIARVVARRERQHHEMVRLVGWDPEHVFEYCEKDP